MNDASVPPTLIYGMMMPIIARDVEADRQRVAGQLDLVQVQASFALQTVPLGQVTEGNSVEWEDPIITRFNRRTGAVLQAFPRSLRMFVYSLHYATLLRVSQQLCPLFGKIQVIEPGPLWVAFSLSELHYLTGHTRRLAITLAAA